jgi:Tol biopolymer transport system component
VKGAGNEMAITNVEGSTTGFTVITETEVVEDFSWHPDGNRILLGKHSPEHAGHRLFICDPMTLKITLLETQPMDQKSVSGVWSPDGSQIVFSSTPNPKAVPWEPKH